jgi:AcrR family transcriptional regulator
MSSDIAPRSRRERPAKPALSREAIVDAALAIAHDEGVEALTMRRLAQSLDTGPASLYVYVANRQELHDLLFDAAVGTIDTEPVDPERWREQLKALVRRIVKLMVEDYPGLAGLAIARIPTGDNALRVTDSMLALLKAGGASDQAAAYAGDFVNLYATAIAYEQTVYNRASADPDHQQQEVEALAERFRTLDAERFPTLAALGPALTRGDGEERFELGLDVIINGLLATPTDGRLTKDPWSG